MNLDLNDRPAVVIWEMTRACALACRHCRASAESARHPLELTTAEAESLVDQVAECHPLTFVLTGGDPVRRPDLIPIIRHASGRGLRVGLTPSATPELLKVDFAELKRAGVARLALSLDGASRETHDAFRGVPGAWDLTMEAIARANACEIQLQINTTFVKSNLVEFDAFSKLMERLRPVLWSVFQLVPVGRGQTQDMLSGIEMEELFQKLYQVSRATGLDIKTTEGHHYRRVALQNGSGLAALRGRAPVGINDGKGFVFISHLGDIFPSGFLPLPAGNVRRNELLEAKLKHPAFRRLRDASQLEGKCGRCEFKTICGGSRARAYAATGNYMAEEPCCIYQPAAISA